MEGIRLKLGRLEQLFVLLLVAYAVLSFVARGSLYLLLLKFTIAAVGFWVIVRVSRTVVRSSLWRLRNRLMVASDPLSK